MANSFINKKADLTTTDLTTLYTVPSFKTAVVKSLLVSEDAGSGSTITITLVNASSAIFNLFKDKAIASKATTEFEIRKDVRVIMPSLDLFGETK
jgi:hypothetical protein